MDNIAFDNDGAPTLISVKQNTDVIKDSTPDKLVNGVDELKKNSEKNEYEIVIEGDDGEKKIVIQEEMEMEKEQASKPYSDMGKEDLLRFSDTVFWRRARLISILVFWAAWLALLGAVIGLTIVAPRCGDPPVPQWWQKTVIYQVYIRSFYDTNQDGIGDLNGITEKLDHIKELGAGAILISSFYRADDAAGSADFGYQVLDHKEIQSTYGTMADFEHLVNETHKRDMAILLDFIPNYTSLNHTWYNEFKTNSDYSNPYWNYYVWAECVNSSYVNNWVSVYGESAWSPLTGTKCYLHQFLNTQPELNLRSTGVKTDLEGILKFWLDKGIDGFRVVASAHLVESQDLQNELSTCPPTDQKSNCHNYTWSQPENYELISQWRSIVESYNGPDGRKRILLTDSAEEPDKAMNYYGTYGRGGGANLPINFQLTKINDTCGSSCIHRLVYAWLDKMQQRDTTDWLTGDQDRTRQMSRVGGSFVNVFNMIKMTLPGSAFIYYGEEIGMVNGNNQGHDPAGIINPAFSRDGYRTPMQWNNETNAGFTNSSSWIEVPTNIDLNTFNVKDQNATEGSVMNQLKTLLRLRTDQKSIQFGKLHNSSQEQVFSFVREHEGFDRILVVGSFGDDSGASVDLTKQFKSIGIPSWADVVFVTNSTMQQVVGESTDLRNVQLSPGQGFIAKWAYERP